MTALVDPPRTLPYDYDPGEAVADLRLAMVARAIDERELTLQKQNKVFFEISGAGHEALGLGLARSLRPGHDWFFPYYRDLALNLGLGVTPRSVLLQAVGSAEDPSSGGRQMPSHWGDRALHIVSQSSPTGSQVPPAVGSAEATKYLGGDDLTYVSLGEGACSEGEVWESLSVACTLALPLLVVVADNGWAISVPARQQAPASIDQLLSGFPGLQIYDLNGCDYFAARRVGERATAWVREGKGPALIHAKVTRPLNHSSQDTQAKYRPAEELAEEARNDPIRLLADALVEAGVLTAADVESLRAEAHALVAEAAQSALAAARPEPVSVADHVVALPELVETAPLLDGEPVTMVDAINRTLHDVLAADDRVRVFGEDVADAPEALLDVVEGKGGVFGTTRGLQRRFGSDRCYNTPIAEASIVGRALGQAIRGLRPCAEIQFFDYIWPAMQQLRSEAATLRWRSNGTWSAPMVVRVPIGGYVPGAAIWHSQCGESIFAHVPGLLVAFPSRAADAAGLLRASFLAEDPVLFLEHKHLFRQKYASDPYPGPDHVVPFGRGVVRRPGNDLTIVTWGATVEKCLQVPGSVEVIDLRTIVPWDQELVASSVRRTGRLLVVHEDTLTGGFGAEVAAWAADELWSSLRAPIKRVAALDTPVPYEPGLLDVVLPQVADIAAAARALLAPT
jgi:2-oxoisovalerate dehydrogenase E1 component